MQKVIKVTLYLFIGIVAATAAVVLCGLCFLWFRPDSDIGHRDLPYLGYLLGVLVAEVIAVVIMMARRGFKYLPEVVIHKREEDTLEFMRKMFKRASTVTIISNRFAWIKNSQTFIEDVLAVANGGTLIEVVTPKQVSDDVRLPLTEGGIRFYVTGEDVPPEARFTLFDGNRSGAERLAIAKGAYPEHEITIFNSNSGPQIIGMAKDIIRKSKAMSNEH